MQFGDDWPGVFIRGDHSLLGYLPGLRLVLQKLPMTENGLETIEDVMAAGALRGIIQLLESCDAGVTAADSNHQKLKGFDDCR